ncbi:MAG: hypothetical protein ACMG6E_01950 [Candidatus Roizmanbacteria bacterium]
MAEAAAPSGSSESTEAKKRETKVYQMLIDCELEKQQIKTQLRHTTVELIETKQALKESVEERKKILFEQLVQSKQQLQDTLNGFGRDMHDMVNLTKAMIVNSLEVEKLIVPLARIFSWEIGRGEKGIMLWIPNAECEVGFQVTMNEKLEFMVDFEGLDEFSKVYNAEHPCGPFATIEATAAAINTLAVNVIPNLLASRKEAQESGSKE